MRLEFHTAAAAAAADVGRTPRSAMSLTAQRKRQRRRRGRRRLTEASRDGMMTFGRPSPLPPLLRIASSLIPFFVFQGRRREGGEERRTQQITDSPSPSLCPSVRPSVCRASSGETDAAACQRIDHEPHVRSSFPLRVGELSDGRRRRRRRRRRRGSSH